MLAAVAMFINDDAALFLNLMIVNEEQLVAGLWPSSSSRKKTFHYSAIFHANLSRMRLCWLKKLAQFDHSNTRHWIFSS